MLNNELRDMSRWIFGKLGILFLSAHWMTGTQRQSLFVFSLFILHEAIPIF
jgi:hypothetical protein